MNTYSPHPLNPLVYRLDKMGQPISRYDRERRIAWITIAVAVIGTGIVMALAYLLSWG